MEIQISELLKGKPTIIKNKEFFQTKNYVEPFFEKMSAFTSDFRIQVRTPEQLTMSGSQQDLTYNRVWIQAVLPSEHTIDNHDEVIGFLYGIDVKRPVAKIYRGYLNQACTNLCVFNPQWINVQEMIPGDPLDYKPIKHLLEETSDFSLKLKQLKTTTVSRDDRKLLLGDWVDYSLREHQDYGFGKVKIAVSTPVDAYKQLFIDQDSPYFIPDGIDPTMFDVYNSFSQIITDDKKDIMNKFEKTILINRLLKVS